MGWEAKDGEVSVLHKRFFALSVCEFGCVSVVQGFKYILILWMVGC